MMKLLAGPCSHNEWAGVDYPCPDCDPTPNDPVLRSKGFTFAGGKEQWHNADSIAKQTKEMFENAKRYGNEPPEPVNGYASGGPGASLL